MRIAHLTTVHHPFDPRIFHKQLVTLAEAGFETHLVAPHTRSEERRGVQITALPRVGGRYGRLRVHPAMYRAARRLRADLYHFHDPELIPVAYLLKCVTGARIVYDMHENYRLKGPVEGRLVRALERFCFSWVDHVVVANAGQRYVPRAAGAPSTVIANYYQPVPEESVPERPPLEDLRLVYTGVSSRRRGLMFLVDLAALVRERRPRWRLDVVGLCPVSGDRRRADERLRATGGEAVFQRTGWDTYVPSETIRRAARRAHVGLALFPEASDFPEVIPTKFYEYLHAGLPILCSAFPRWRAFVERHDCGRAVPPGDAEAAFQVLRAWAANPARYRDLSAAARAAASQYRWPAMGRRLVRLYHQLLPDPSLSRCDAN